MPSTTMVHVRVDEKVKEGVRHLGADGNHCFRRYTDDVGAYSGGEGAPVRRAGPECHDGQGHEIRRQKAGQAVPLLEGIV